jgi:hypothetical protein
MIVSSDWAPPRGGCQMISRESRSVGDPSPGKTPLNRHARVAAIC